MSEEKKDQVEVSQQNVPEENKELAEEVSLQHSSEDESSDSEEVEESKLVKMVLCVRNDLKMGKGKIAAQCSHATLGAYKIAVHTCPDLLASWERQGQPKVVVKIDGKSDMKEIVRQCREKNVNYCVISDAGRTQVDPGTNTVVAVGPGPLTSINLITGSYKLL
eukprot:GCRY01000938.1.p1 GENE.GCRY01000938.1~~GCRY01000938.1.p1  ORF type:complete len:164 (-),score=23.39 GCRY01000938.1:297-788(-)